MTIRNYYTDRYKGLFMLIDFYWYIKINISMKKYMTKYSKLFIHNFIKFEISMKRYMKKKLNFYTYFINNENACSCSNFPWQTIYIIQLIIFSSFFFDRFSDFFFMLKKLFWNSVKTLLFIELYLFRKYHRIT